MRDQQLVLPFGCLPKRKFFLSAFAIFMAVFAFLVASAPTADAQAAPTTAASWNGNSIMYNQHEFTPIADARAGDSHGLPTGSKIYAYTEPITSGPGNPTTKAHLIYFAPGTDPPTATSATYASYNLQGTTYSNPSAPVQLTLTPQAGTTSGDKSSCTITGVGWIVCGVSTFLATCMDWLFTVLANFLTVQPLQSASDNALYRGWSIMRNFANVAFVIGFLIVIYSQITNLGLSNYGLKKMLPRLIVAAVLVNVSYWICTIAVDASNILGYSVQDIFMNIRENIGGTNASVSMIGQWESITSAVLAGGTLATAGVIALVSIGSVSGAIALLLPTLVFVIIAALVAILIMAVRQALIVILVIIAPLAFVAFLLPNTEKYFEKWKSLFLTMLTLFPIFAVIFGGSQVAGTAIIQNANSIIMLILGMATQVAPLFVLPFLIKFSGGLIGQIAGIANNKSKGLLDRTRNFAQEKADLKKSRNQARPPRRTWLGRNASLRGLVQGAENRRLDRESEMKTNQTKAENSWRRTKGYQALHNAAEEANMLKEAGEASAQTAANRLKTINGERLQMAEVNMRNAKLDLDVSKTSTDVQWENLRAESSKLNVIPAHLAVQALHAQTQTREAAVVARQLHEAQHQQQQDFAKALQASPALQVRAGGISEHGADSALASAVATTRKAYADSVSEAEQIVKHFNLSSNERQRLARGEQVEIKDSAGKVIKVFDEHSTFAREAVIETQIKYGTVKEAQELIELSGSTLSQFKTTIGDAAAEGGLGGKTIYVSGQTLDNIKQGKIGSKEAMVGAIQDTIAKGKISADKLSIADPDALKHILNAARTTDTSYMSPGEVAKLAGAIQDLKRQAEKALDDPILQGKLQGNAKPIIEQIKNL